MANKLPSRCIGSRRSSLLYASVCVAAALLWQALTVTCNFGGNWTALFYAGEAFSVPDSLAAEQIYRFAESRGYDGQFYHYIAHDPLLREEFSEFVDDPRLRWRRILVPGLAFLATLGSDGFIDAAYLAIVLAFVFLGAYWLSRYGAYHGRNAAWGLCFLLVPATAISTERLTVDVALTALCVAYVLCVATKRESGVLAVLTLAPLARETGLLLTLGHAGCHALERRWKRSFLAATTALPFLGWALFVAMNTPASAGNWFSIPFAGLVVRTVEPFPTQAAGARELIAMILDYVAVAGVWLALIQTFQVIRRGSTGPIQITLAAFALGAVLLYSPKVWSSAYAFGRVFSPWFVLLGMVGLSSRKSLLFLPAAFPLPRIAAQFGSQLAGILEALCG